MLWGVSASARPCPESLSVGFCGVNFGRLRFSRTVGALLFDLARRNKAAGLKTTAACNRCDAVLWIRAWRSEPCVDRLACLAGANDVRSPVAVSDNDPTRRSKTGTIDHADQDSLAVKTFNCDPGCRGARPLLTRQHAATQLGCTRVIDSQTSLHWRRQPLPCRDFFRWSDRPRGRQNDKQDHGNGDQ